MILALSVDMKFGMNTGRCPYYGYPSTLNQYRDCRREGGGCRGKILLCSTICRRKAEEIGWKVKVHPSKISADNKKLLQAAKQTLTFKLAAMVYSLNNASRQHYRLSVTFHLCWRCIAGGVMLIPLFLNFIAEPSPGHSASLLPTSYACEDISHYYSYLEDLKGAQLMAKLHNVVSDHHSLPYAQVWDALQILDAADVEHPKDSPDVIEIYSLRSVSKLLAGKPEGWNREHLWPRSYGLTNGPELTDLHNLRPADMNVNSSRGNKYYGECLPSSNDCLRPANYEAASDTATDKESWTPPAQVRGDIARSVMYMAVRYGFDQPPGSPNLKLSDSPSIENAQMGLLSVLLRWNEIDPPSRSEHLRNNNICSIYQHNRNPFVDHPEYATLIWGPSRPAPVPIDSQSGAKLLSPEKISKNAWINELHYENKGKDENEFIEVAVGSSMDPCKLKLVLYNGANGRMYGSLSLADSAIFSTLNVKQGFSLYTVFFPSGSLQNGPADGVALVEERNDNVHVIQFLSYDGSVEAVDGPAQGLLSSDIRVKENKASSAHDSLGLTGTGFRDFRWTTFMNSSSPGKWNKEQSLPSQ